MLALLALQPPGFGAFAERAPGVPVVPRVPGEQPEKTGRRVRTFVCSLDTVIKTYKEPSIVS